MTEEDAIKRIKDFGLYHAIKDLPHSMRTVEAFEMAIEALKRQEAQWISCEKGLPLMCGVYTVTRIIEGRSIIDACYFDGSDTWHDDNRINHDRKYLVDVVAWMPKPEPYKGETNA